MNMARVERAFGATKSGSGKARGGLGVEGGDGWELQQGSSICNVIRPINSNLFF